MQASADSIVLTPPPEPAAVRGFVLAVAAHALLIAALTWGINWDRDTSQAPVEAELWSALPQEAAPPAPPPPPQVVQAPPVVQPPPQPVQKEPDIALEREKQRKAQEAKRREQEEEKRKQLEAQRRKEELQQQKLAEEKKQREEQAKKDKARKELDAKLAKLREENLKRMLAEAAGTGSPSAAGTAPRATGGPSADYAGRIRARVKPNIVFADNVPGNPVAEVEVRMSPDGTIVGRKITKPSGVQSWDEAVLRALDRTEVLPRDVDGRVHSPLIIKFSLRG